MEGVADLLEVRDVLAPTSVPIDPAGVVMESEALLFSSGEVPQSRKQANGVVVPFGALFSPFMDSPAAGTLSRTPTLCRSCGSYAHCYCHVEFDPTDDSARWTCSFCGERAFYLPPGSENAHRSLFPELNEPLFDYPDRSQGFYTSSSRPFSYILLLDTTWEQESMFVSYLPPEISLPMLI